MVSSRQTLVVVLLVVSILFSVASILLTLSLDISSPTKVAYQYNSPSLDASSSGGVGLIVQPQVGVTP